MTEQAVTKIVGAVYAAFATMLSDEGLALMNDTLRFAAATGSDEEKRILGLIADTTKRSGAVQ
jgi:hypothetical protein